MTENSGFYCNVNYNWVAFELIVGLITLGIKLYTLYYTKENETKKIATKKEKEEEKEQEAEKEKEAEKEAEKEKIEETLSVSPKKNIPYEEKYLQKYQIFKLYFFLDKRKEENDTHIDHEARYGKLMNNSIMEKTPIGNVLMYYNAKNECFDYYSDSTVPYRYLEVVCRKYVMTYYCPELYIDMEEEIQKIKQQQEEQKAQKAQKEKQEKQETLTEEERKFQMEKEKRNKVFARFKHYNKEGGSGRVNMAAPPKNSISGAGGARLFFKGQKMEKEKENETCESNESNSNILKERTNRYSHQGKLMNYSFLQKIDLVKVKQKLALTYASFKQKQKQK